jgi:hypothetical protein
VGVSLFDPEVGPSTVDRDARARELRDVASKLSLLPRKVRPRTKALKDDF